MPTGKLGPNGEVRTVWADYLAGTDPTDVNSVFTALIDIVDGEIVIGWKPNLNTDAEVRQYRVMGCTSLDANDWTWPADSAIHRFFKVEVSPSDESSASDKPGPLPEN